MTELVSPGNLDLANQVDKYIKAGLAGHDRIYGAWGREACALVFSVASAGGGREMVKFVMHVRNAWKKDWVLFFTRLRHAYLLFGIFFNTEPCLSR